MMYVINRRAALFGAAILTVPASASAQTGGFTQAAERRLSDAHWRARLSNDAYAVLRRSATERPYTSPQNDEHRRGVFACAGCRLSLFRSQWKFESGTGWPSFYRAIGGALATRRDRTAGMVRTEYHCARCLGHQGHLFNDGPQPTGLRYCNNGVALLFTPA